MEYFANFERIMKRIVITLALTALAAVGASAQSAEQKEGQRRGRMLTEVEWQPLHDVVLCRGNGRIVPALTPKKGMLYSSAAEFDKFVPFDVSLHTFLTCVHNPYSLLYTEDTNKKSSRSAYGIRYTGTPGTGAWMGCVCTKFSAFAAGWGVPFISKNYPDLYKEGIIDKVEDQSAQGVQVLDLLWQKGHARAVTDVERDEDGRVSAVEVSESVSPTAVRRRFTADEFEALMEKHKITIYRTVDYSRTGIAPIYDDPQPLVYNDALCTFAGDRACFREGDLIIIHCFQPGMKRLELFRGEQRVAVIPLRKNMRVNNEKLGIRGNLKLDPGAWAVDLSPLKLTHGMYKARLTNGRKTSDYTYFEIIRCSISYNNGKLSFSSIDAPAVFWNVGRAADARIITDKQRARGQVSTGRLPSYAHSVKVHFQGRYGRVACSADLP